MGANEKTVLIIDDDVDFQFMIMSMLRLSGFAVKSLTEGQLIPTIDSAKMCDLVLMDIALPGVNGVDIARELKSLPQTASIPIILLSGHHECDRQFLKSKANALFRKPFSLRQLLHKVNELLKLDVAKDHESNLTTQLTESTIPRINMNCRQF